MSTAAVKPHPAANRSTQAADGASERAVLTHLLDRHPRRLSFAQLAADLSGRCDREAVQRAVENLAAAAFLVIGPELAVSPVIAQLDRLSI